jgi:hypothetical protein
MLRVLTAFICAGLLAGCASSSFDPYSGAPLASASRSSGPMVIPGSSSPSSIAVAGPAGCAGPISEYQQLLDSDAETGHLNPGVYNRIGVDLERVRASCAAGREAEARNQLAEVKRRYGYH